MPQFRYQATDPEGHTQTGTIEARDALDARSRLNDQGWTVEQLVLEDSDTPPAPSSDSQSSIGTSSISPSSPGSSPPRLNAADAEEVVAQVAEIGKANIPMSIGLRAAAAESTNGRVRRALEHLAHGTEQGKSLEDVMGAEASRFPRHVAGLIMAATQTSQLGGAIEELLEHQRMMRDIRSTVVTAMLYPIVVLSLATVVFFFLMLEIVPVFRQMFDEFELDLPIPTTSLIGVSDVFVALTTGDQKWHMLGVVVAFLVGVLAIRFIVGAGGWRRFLGTTPLFGPIVAWSGAAAFAQMLGVLLDYEIPLPRALELTADASRDGNVREACHHLALGAADGQSIASMLEETNYLPETLVPFVRSGEQHGDLAGALRMASRIFVERIGLRASLLSSVSPPIIFVFVVLGIGFSVISLFMPLMVTFTGLM